jgi:hypothetical protein
MTDADIKPIVQGLMLSGLPPPLAPKGGPVEDMTRCIYYLAYIVAPVMQSVYTEALLQETEKHTKLLLAFFELADKVLRDKELLPKWIAA